MLEKIVHDFKTIEPSSTAMEQVRATPKEANWEMLTYLDPRYIRDEFN